MQQLHVGVQQSESHFANVGSFGVQKLEPCTKHAFGCRTAGAPLRSSSWAGHGLNDVAFSNALISHRSARETAMALSGNRSQLHLLERTVVHS